MDYALLPGPGQNPVYFDAAREMLRRELCLSLAPWGVADAAWTALGGRDYLCFSAPELPPEALREAARTSGYFALFAREGALLRPLDARAERAFPDRLTAMLKYSGKTGEQFTRLLVNLARAYGQAAGPRPVVLDPLCGRGTTLFEAMTLGLDAVGVEQSAAAVQEGEAFLLRFLKEERYKHTCRQDRPRDSAGRQTRRTVVTTARDADAWKRGETQCVTFLHGDTLHLDGILPGDSVHYLVADLPYGVQHGSHQGGGRSRGAAALVEAALPGWRRLLRPGGSAVLAFNAHTTPWQSLAQAAQCHGFTVLSAEGGWRHRVAQAILRDVIILRK